MRILPLVRPAALCLLCALSPLSLAAADPSTPAPEPTATSTPEAARPSPKKAPTPSPGSVLNIHHKMLDPAWGRVVQYRKYEVKAYSEKERETLHEFVLQDTDNVVRVATYHENAKGEGYWEVWVWDLP